MRKRGGLRGWPVLVLAICTSLAHAACVPFEKAPEHIGEIVCVQGRVLKVTASPSGTHYLNFCDSYPTCPFTVVIFRGHLDDIGDVRSLVDHDIQIDGLVKLYNGRPEIVLSETAQLHGEAAARIPRLPKNYDVARHGSYSAGTFRAKKPKRAKSRTLTDQSDAMNDDSVPE